MNMWNLVIYSGWTHSSEAFLLSYFQCRYCNNISPEMLLIVSIMKMIRLTALGYIILLMLTLLLLCT